MTITAVIVHYDGESQEIRAAVNGLLAQTRPPTEILIVDNSPGQGLTGSAHTPRW